MSYTVDINNIQSEIETFKRGELKALNSIGRFMTNVIKHNLNYGNFKKVPLSPFTLFRRPFTGGAAQQLINTGKFLNDTTYRIIQDKVEIGYFASKNPHSVRLALIHEFPYEEIGGLKVKMKDGKEGLFIPWGDEDTFQGRKISAYRRKKWQKMKRWFWYWVRKMGLFKRGAFIRGYPRQGGIFIPRRQFIRPTFDELTAGDSNSRIGHLIIEIFKRI